MGFLTVIIFFGSSYLMGNYVFDSFCEDINGQLLSTFFGIILWIGAIMLITIAYLIYHTTIYLIN